MIVTKEIVRDKLLAYLNNQISLPELVDWAENSLCDGELDTADPETLRDIIARLGLADVRQFGLSWADCSNFLGRLGYRVQVEVIPIGT
jgi:hypothetical protein